MVSRAGNSTGVHLSSGQEDSVRSSVSKYYGETLQASSDLRTSACCTAKPPSAEVRELLAKVPQDIVSRYYGCGSPFPVGLQHSGLRVLDLGCGTGRDCYICAALVGEEGSVTGIDMTPAQLEVAEKHQAAWQQQLGYSKQNMTFVQGQIENLSAAGVAAGSVDLIISNCVINLSPDKAAVLKEAYQALAPGGEVYFSDVYCDRRLPGDVRCHEVLLGECLGGALYINDFLQLAAQVGFVDPRVLEVEGVAVHDEELIRLVGQAAFYSITIRLFKLPELLEPLPQEDYGQTATYQGTLPGAADSYVLDCLHVFPKGVPVRVSGNTSAILTATWLAPHFKVNGDKSSHLGEFIPASDTGHSHSSTLTARSIIEMQARAGSGKSAPSCAAQGSDRDQPQVGGCCGPATTCKPPAKGNSCKPTAGSSCCPAPVKAAAARQGPGCCGP